MMFERTKRWWRNLSDVNTIRSEVVELIKSRERYARDAERYKRQRDDERSMSVYYRDREVQLQTLLAALRATELPPEVAALAKSVQDFEEDPFG